MADLLNVLVVAMENSGKRWRLCLQYYTLAHAVIRRHKVLLYPSLMGATWLYSN